MYKLRIWQAQEKCKKYSPTYLTLNTNAIRGRCHHLGSAERETKEHVLKKHVFPPTESVSAHRQTVGGPGHTALGCLTTPFVQMTVSHVPIRNFGTQQAGEYSGAETSHPHYGNLAFATT